MLWDYDNDLGIQLDFNVSDYVTDENVGFDLYEEGDCEAHHIQCPWQWLTWYSRFNRCKNG